MTPIDGLTLNFSGEVVFILKATTAPELKQRQHSLSVRLGVLAGILYEHSPLTRDRHLGAIGWGGGLFGTGAIRNTLAYF